MQAVSSNKTPHLNDKKRKLTYLDEALFTCICHIFALTGNSTGLYVKQKEPKDINKIKIDTNKNTKMQLSR